MAVAGPSEEAGASLTIRNDVTVELVDSMGSDDSIIKAMLVSTQGSTALEAEATYGRINFLMKNRHGTPFEHGAMTFYVEAPITVFREFHRHRIGFSYNEMSGRYRQLPPTFYVPGCDRPLIQVGKPGAYEYVPESDDDKFIATIKDMCEVYALAYRKYEAILRRGHAKEVARGVLPVNLYSAMFVTCNPRSMMSFLSLRTQDDNSLFPSKPMWEIAMVANEMEREFANLFPLTWQSFDANRRVSP